MNKVALKRIGFAEQNETNDQWVMQQEEEQQRSGSVMLADPSIRLFKSIDQETAQITEELNIDASGNRYRQQVQFTVRTPDDRALAKRYERRPLVMHVWTVDGNHYKIGTKSYPAYMQQTKTNSRETVETAITVEYETLTPII